jgi:hypothetical protein
MTTNYTIMTDSVKAALNAEKSADNTWGNAAKHILEFFGNPEGLLAVKAQFCTDVVIPLLEKRHRDALALEIPRKGSKLDTEPEKNEVARKAKKDATATRDTMFMHVLKKAWPKYGNKEDDGDDKPDATDSDKIRKALAELVTRIQKKGGLDFDAAAVVGFLNKAVAAAAPKN